MPKQLYDETEFLTFLRSGHQKAFDELYRRFAPTFLGILLRIVGDQQQAEDLLQDSFIKIWLSLPTYDSQKGRLFTWMLNVVRYTAFDYLKAARRRKTHPIDDIPLELAGTVVPFYHVIGVANWVNSTLSAELIEVIEYAYFRDLSHSELAKQLNIPLGTVKTRVRRALQILRENV